MRTISFMSKREVDLRGEAIFIIARLLEWHRSCNAADGQKEVKLGLDG